MEIREQEKMPPARRQSMRKETKGKKRGRADDEQASKGAPRGSRSSGSSDEWRRIAAAPRPTKRKRNKDSLEKYLDANPQERAKKRFDLEPLADAFAKLYPFTPETEKAGIAGFPRPYVENFTMQEMPHDDWAAFVSLQPEDHVLAPPPVWEKIIKPGSAAVDPNRLYCCYDVEVENELPAMPALWVRENHALEAGIEDRTDNCFFRSIAQAIYGSELHADKVHEKVADFIEKDAKGAAERLVLWEGPPATVASVMDIARMLRAPATSGGRKNEFGANTSVKALTARAFGVELNIIRDGVTAVQVFYPDGKCDRVWNTDYPDYYMNTAGREPIILFANDGHAEHAYFNRPRGRPGFNRRRAARGNERGHCLTDDPELDIFAREQGDEYVVREYCDPVWETGGRGLGFDATPVANGDWRAAETPLPPGSTGHPNFAYY